MRQRNHDGETTVPARSRKTRRKKRAGRGTWVAPGLKMAAFLACSGTGLYFFSIAPMLQDAVLNELLAGAYDEGYEAGHAEAERKASHHKARHENGDTHKEGAKALALPKLSVGKACQGTADEFSDACLTELADPAGVTQWPPSFGPQITEVYLDFGLNLNPRFGVGTPPHVASIGFEPQPSVCQSARRDTADRANVFVVCAGVSSSDGLMPLTLEGEAGADVSQSVGGRDRAYRHYSAYRLSAAPNNQPTNQPRTNQPTNPSPLAPS